jgi:predicted nucleic acid-binding protein
VSVVVESGVTIKWMIAEPHTAEARALRDYSLRQRIALIAPTLLGYEVASVLRRKTRDGEITDAAAKLALHDILRIVTLVPFDYALTERAIDITASTRQKAAYDAHYLALAEREGADFWTADQPFFTATHGQFPQVRWVGAYPLLPRTS